ncbi:MAG: DUF4386 family protein [Acidobacteria bacterium]|nr:DUF4386 family protein [Acidobacteriota bacterium]MBK9709499.1 DUF4386 family protein [Acidobacteriota bacterium]
MLHVLPKAPERGLDRASVLGGCWSLPRAALVFSSRILPKWLAAPVRSTGAGYLFDSSAYQLSPGRPMISPFTVVGEPVLPL